MALLYHDGSAVRFQSGEVIPLPELIRQGPNRNATVDKAFSFAIAPYFRPFQQTYSVQSGTLPTGITLNTSTGVLSGTATATASATPIVIRATNAGGFADTNTFTIAVVEPNEAGGLNRLSISISIGL